jgi:hypothetical protein
MSKISLLVSVHSEYRERLPEVALKLQTAGMQVAQWMAEIGVITGSIDSEKVGVLSRIEGVASVESSVEYQLPSPEEEIQ